MQINSAILFKELPDPGPELIILDEVEIRIE